jgi:hypothetical protein
MTTQPLQVLFTCGIGGPTAGALLALAGRSGATVPVHAEGIAESRRITAAGLLDQVATFSTYKPDGE